jgi:hypothetical protein
MSLLAAATAVRETAHVSCSRFKAGAAIRAAPLPLPSGPYHSAGART